MLDDATLDRLLAEAAPRPDAHDDTDAAWTRLVSSAAAGRRRRRRRRLVPAAALASAAVALALINWLPSGDAGAVPTAYAAAINRGEQALAAGTGPVLYVDTVTTVTGASFGTRRFLNQSWEASGASRYEGTGSGRGVSNRVTDVAMLGGFDAYYTPADQTLYVNRRPAGDTSPSLGFFGSIPGAPVLQTMIAVLLNAQRDRGSASAASVAGVVEQLTRLSGARVARRNGLITISVTSGRYRTRVVARLGGLSPVAVTMVRPDPTHTRSDDVTRIQFIHYEYLSPRVGARQLDLLDVYPNAKVIVTHHRSLSEAGSGTP